MKMLMVFVMICGLLCGINFSPIESLNLKDLFGNQEIEVFVDTDAVDGFQSVANGTGSVIFASVSDLDYILNSYNVQGYTVKIKNMEVFDVVESLGGDVVEICEFGVYGSLHGFFPEITVKDKKCNFQVCSYFDGALLGVPMLLGGY